MTHLSLCSGIGGLDLAAEWAGFETIAQCEIDEYASKVLAKNFPGVVNLHDIRTVDARLLAEHGIGKPTVISAGFPCQPYSLAGKGRGDRDERDLWGEVARVLGEIKSRWFVGENTPGLFARSNQRFFRRVLDDLTALGYSVGWGMWGACNVGAPHKRERVFIIARNISDPVCKRGMDEQFEIDATKRGEQAFYDAFQLCGKIPDTDSEQARRLPIGKATSHTELGRVCEHVPHADSMWKLQQKRSKQNVREWTCDSSWWQAEPDVGRVVDGVPNRVDRLRCLGNAVVPAQAYPIFKAIYDEEMREIKP